MAAGIPEVVTMGHQIMATVVGMVTTALHVVAVLVVALPTSRLGRNVKYA
jgi:hypothetical protein